MLRRQFVGRLQYKSPLEGILEFAHIAGPVVALELLQRFIGNMVELPSHRCIQARKKMIGQKRNIVAAVAQRRKLERNDADAVKQIFAELILGDHLGQIPIRGGNDSNIDRDLLSTSDPPKVSFLQNAQQLTCLGTGSPPNPPIQ